MRSHAACACAVRPARYACHVAPAAPIPIRAKHSFQHCGADPHAGAWRGRGSSPAPKPSIALEKPDHVLPRKRVRRGVGRRALSSPFVVQSVTVLVETPRSSASVRLVITTGKSSISHWGASLGIFVFLEELCAHSGEVRNQRASSASAEQSMSLTRVAMAIRPSVHPG